MKNFYVGDFLDGGWRKFNKLLPKLTEQQLQSALDEEATTRKRREYLFRLHRKFNQVRYKRERRSLGIDGSK